MSRVTLVQLNRGAEQQGRCASDEVTGGVGVAGSGSIGNTWASASVRRPREDRREEGRLARRIAITSDSRWVGENFARETTGYATYGASRGGEGGESGREER